MLTSRLVLAAPLLFGGGRLAPPPGVVMRAGDSDATLAPRSLPFLLQPEPGLAIGGALLFALLVNRALFTPELYNAQSRADLIATVAPVLIVLKALGDLDITPREAEAVAAVGYAGEWLEPALSEDARDELDWAGNALLEIGPCTSVALWRDGKTLMLRGTLPNGMVAGPEAVVPGPLLTKAAARNNGAPDYLPAVQLLPGRVEFSYLPPNAQGVLMLPLVGATKGALVLACDQQRGFGTDDVEWARAVAGRLAESLEGA